MFATSWSSESWSKCCYEYRILPATWSSLSVSVCAVSTATLYYVYYSILENSHKMIFSQVGWRVSLLGSWNWLWVQLTCLKVFALTWYTLLPLVMVGACTTELVNYREILLAMRKSGHTMTCPVWLPVLLLPSTKMSGIITSYSQRFRPERVIWS